MPRRMRCRNVEKLPDYELFGPINQEILEDNIILLTVDELEAMRLKDIEGLDQEQCAEKMEVSRQTFQLILGSAREKVTNAIICGKVLSIKGGHYKLKSCTFRCNNCEELYDVQYIEDKNKCPICGSEDVVCKKRNIKCNKWCNN